MPEWIQQATVRIFSADFVTLFVSILVEALPFIVLGVIVSTFVALFVNDKWFFKLIPKNRFLSHAMVGLFGAFMPVCECGNVPVARRLMTKGFSVSHSIVFLLCAPIVNPVVLISTLQAFQTKPFVAVIRIVAGYAIGLSFGLFVSYMKDQKSILTEGFTKNFLEDEPVERTKLQEGVRIFSNEFFDTFKMLMIGAFIASLTQMIIPRDIIIAIGQNPVGSVLAMLVLAFVVSICSNVDAFFALAYAGTFRIGSILSFLVFGPMIDIKMLLMMKNTYKVKFLIMMTAYVFILSAILGLTMNLIL